jgi:hypothetical protein
MSMNGDLFIERGAEISPCGRYRTALWRSWDKAGDRLVFIMLNPSIADAHVDDATIRVCMGRARLMGCGKIRVANLFTLRATDPKELRVAKDPVGPDADRALWQAIVGQPRMVIAAWGDDGAYRNREAEAIRILCGDYGIDLYCLGVTKAGHPKHPLRIPYSVQPFLWKSAREVRYCACKACMLSRTRIPHDA